MTDTEALVSVQITPTDLTTFRSFTVGGDTRASAIVVHGYVEDSKAYLDIFSVGSGITNQDDLAEALREIADVLDEGARAAEAAEQEST